MQFLRTNILNLVCLFLACYTSGFAQQPRFQKTYEGEPTEIPSSLRQVRDDGFVMLGQSHISIPDSLPAQSGIRLVRLEKDGSIRWTKCYGGTKDDFGFDVLETLDGGFLIAGQTENADKQHRYAYLIKTDSLGQKQWSKVFTSIDGAFHSLTRTKDNEYLAVGSGPHHLFAVKLDIRANIIWAEMYEQDKAISNPIVKTCEADGNEGFAIGGTTNDQFFLLRIDEEGAPIWAKSFATAYRSECVSVEETADGEFLLAGNVFSGNDDRNAKINVIKVEADGRVRWSNLYGSAKGKDNVAALAKMLNGDFALGFHSSGFSQNIQMGVIFLQEEGLPRKTFVFGDGNRRSEVSGLISTSDNGLAAMGRTNAFKVRRPAYYLVKMDNVGRSGENPRNVRMQIKSVKTESKEQKVTLLPGRFKRDIRYRDCLTEVVASVLQENLICGNVEAVFNPQKIIRAKARARDSMALVALYQSTNGNEWINRWDLRSPMTAWGSIELDQDGRVMKVMLISNKLSGHLPPEIGDLSRLKILWLANNQLSGSLPVELGKLKYLEELMLNNNEFSGVLPVELAQLENLKRLRLDYNQLTGSIPIEFGSFTKLEEFKLNDNNLSGELPPELNLPMTAQLDFSNNQFTGSIPKALINMHGADMKNNEFVPHAKAKLEGLMGGRYTYNDDSGDSYMLILNDETQRFILMKGIYDEEGGKYITVKGRFEWNEKGVYLHGEILEKGVMGDSPNNEETITETYLQKHTLEFEEVQEENGQVKVKLHAFDTELKLEKENSK